MATKRNEWSLAELELLSLALDEIAEQESYESLKQARRYMANKEHMGRFNDSDIQGKLVEWAKIAKTTPAPLVKDWARYKKKVEDHVWRQPSPASSKSNKSTSSNKGTDRDTERKSRSRSSRSPTRKSLRAQLFERARQNRSGSRHRNSESPTASHQSTNGSEVAQDGPQAEKENAPAAADNDGRRTDWALRNFPKLQDDIQHHWKFFELKRDFERSIYGDYARHVYDGVLSRISSGVKSFCKAQPFAHLTSAKPIQATLGLGRVILYDEERSDIEQALKALFADPLIDHETVLRAFAVTAVYRWTMGDSFGTLPREPLESFRPSMNGRLLEFCQRHLPAFVEDLEKEDQLAYLDEVIKPALPGLARQYQNDLFEVFKSLRVPECHPEPSQYAITDPGNPEARSLEYRDWHQGLFERSMEQAFLAALEFKLRLARTDKSHEGHSFYIPHVGEDFDPYEMTVASRTVTDNELTAANKVAICLCPAIHSRSYLDGPKENIEYACILKALVLVEGVENDLLWDGYPVKENLADRKMRDYEWALEDQEYRDQQAARKAPMLEEQSTKRQARKEREDRKEQEDKARDQERAAEFRASQAAAREREEQRAAGNVPTDSQEELEGVLIGPDNLDGWESS